MIDYKRAPTVGVEDLVLLHQINDKSIAENLKQRYSKDIIYTTIGNVLISVNPFKRLPLYTESNIQYYRQHGHSATAPHVFALAEETYRSMIQEEEHQCVIISGESGAGKTEASKQILQYIAAVSGNSKEMQRVKTIIMDSNPLLESFGNAKTVRNDNSSRFGKFFEVYFDRFGGPVGGKMSNFLLEKSRVVRQQKGERNFHVFYQICCGADDSMRSRLKLRQPGEFRYLSQGGTLERAGVNDAQEWKETVAAMQSIGMSEKEQRSIFNILAAILHLGEVEFKEKAGGQHDEHDIVNPDVVEFVADLLEFDAPKLVKAFTWKTFDTGTEVIMVPLDSQQCVNAVEALCKTLYDKLFDFVIRSVNRAFGEQKYDLMLGVLDIYGFEIFDKNGFEQFCINYVNEKLQQIFIELTLKVEQEEYVKEKITWEPIKYFNNQIVCDLVEGRQPPGLFSILDDVCATMSKEKESVADLKMVEKFASSHGQHPHFKRSERSFMIKHYAGDVHYEAAGFVARNKDLLSADLMTAIKDTTCPFVQMLFADVDIDVAGSAKGGSNPKKKATTSGFKIRNQAAELVRTLKNCTPHYVRTIKPNDNKRPNDFDDQRVTHQVKYLGLLENVKVRRAGFSYRQHFDKFMKRFKYVCPATFPRPWKGEDKGGCKAILTHCQQSIPPEGWQLGETKVFIRQPHHLFGLEDLREDAFDKLVVKIQRGWTRYRNSKEYLVLKLGMDKLYKKGQKHRRTESVFRPLLGDYLDYHASLKPLHHLVEYNPLASAWQEHYADNGKKFYFHGTTGKSQWDKPKEMDKPKIIFTDKCQRVVGHANGAVCEELVLLSETTMFLVERKTDTIVTPATKPTKKNPNPPPPPAPYTVTSYLMKKRLDLQFLGAISVSQLADPYVVFHFFEQPVPYRSVTLTPTKGTTHCQGCQAKFTPQLKRANCMSCGALLCLKSCLTQQRPLPTLAQPKPVKVCGSCMPYETYEPQEDVVLNIESRSELVALVRKLYKGLMGGVRMTVVVNNTIHYQLAGEGKPRQIVFQHNPQAKESQLFVGSPTQLTVHSPDGISQAKIAQIENSREERRKAAQERHKQELIEEKKKEELREKEREEQRKKEVEEKKRRKREAEEAEFRDQQEKETRIRERKEREARIIAEKQQRKF